MSKKEKYLNLSSDFDDLRHGYGAKEKTVAGAKLFGKSIFNVTKFVFTSAIPAFNEKSKEVIEKNKSK